MEENDYLENRVENQIRWYSNKSSKNQKSYKRLRMMSITLAILIPFLTGFIDEGENSELKWFIGAFGVLIAIIEGALNLFKYQEKWIEYRTISESLKHQKFLFLTNSGPYGGNNKFHVFVEKVEALISQENSQWAEYIKADQPKENK